MTNTLKSQILDISRQNNIGKLGTWFETKLDELIESGYFKNENAIRFMADEIVTRLDKYASATHKSTVVLGMSGGVDSALTAALFKAAGYRVIGVTLPIHQNPEETNRGVEAIKALGLEGLNVDLSNAYDNMIHELENVDSALAQAEKTESNVKIRRGNIRARLRMITLYNIASANDGFVASTDNFSELASGFWTLHGDVGDVSPIQSLLKSWEVPMMAKMMGVPESTWRAKPTDGLGVAGGDEDQFGCSYLELDIILGIMSKVIDQEITSTRQLVSLLETNANFDADEKIQKIVSRMSGTWFKRVNPINLTNPIVGDARYELLKKFDHKVAAPKAFEALE